MARKVAKKVFLISLIFLMVIPTGIFQVIADREVHDHYLNVVNVLRMGLGQFPTFYSPYSNRFYCVWGTEHGGILAYNYVMVYKSSIDGITWGANYTYLPSTGGIMNTIEYYGQENIDYHLTRDGRTLYVVVMNNEDGTPYTIDYRIYNVSMSGSLDLWHEEMNIAVPMVGAINEPANSINIVVDNESRPYIAFEAVDATNQFNDVWIFRGFYTNGSWINHTQRNRWLGDITGSAVDELFWVDLVNTGDGRTATGIGRGCGLLVHWDATNGVGEALDTDLAINYFDGAGWDVDGLGPLGMEDAEGQWDRRSVWIAQAGNISAIVVQIEDLVTPDRKRLDMAFKEGKNPWQNRTALSFELAGDVWNDVQFKACIGIDNETDFVVAWWVEDPNGNESIWYRRGNALQIMTNATWEWQTPITYWQDATRANVFDNADDAGGFNGFLPYNVPMSIQWMYHPEDEVWHDYLFPEDNGELIIPAQHLNTTLYDHTGQVADDWIFEGEVYDLEVYIDNATSFYVNTSDSRHDIQFHWDNSTEESWITVDPNDQFTIGLAHSEFERFGTITRLLWRFIPDRSIIDCEDEAWGFYVENSDMNYNLTGSLGFTTNIYNLGGFTYYNFTGDGNRTVGGQPFEIQATNGTDGSSARAEQIYRKLQSIHLLIEIEMDNEWDAGNGEFDIDPGIGFVDIGIDYRLNGTWELGHYVRLYVQDADVGHHNAGNDHDWVEWSVDWYNYDPGSGSLQNIDSDLIYSNHWGYNNENLSPTYHNRTSSQLWVDLWFDRTNASTTIAGQVNAMYHGMREHGSSWWFGYGAFQPMTSDYGNALFLDDLYDEGRNVTDSLKFDLMRVFLEVGKVADVDGDDETWTIRAVENFNRKQATDRMQGIEQPAFEETLVLDMPMFQSMNPLIRAIDGVSIAIWKGALGFQKILWGALDSFFAWAGFGEGFFSQITAFLMLLPELFSKMMENMGVAIAQMITMIDNVFTMVITGLPEFVLGLGYITDYLIDYWQFLQQLLRGDLGGLNILQTVDALSWVRFGFAMLPTFEIFGVIFSNDPGRRLKERMDFYSGIFNGLINFIKGFITFMQNAISTIMDILPG